MNSNLQIAARLSSAELANFVPFQYLDPAFYKLSDYFGCFLRGVSCGLILNAPIILLGVASPSLLVNMLPCIAGISCLLGVVFTAVASSFRSAFLDLLSRRGVAAFLTYEDVNLPAAQAYELCLAAAMQIRSALIVQTDECERICVRVKSVPDRTIVIRLDSLRKGKTRISIDCVKHWSSLRSKLVRQLFASKFEQLILRVDDGQNAELIAKTAEFIRETPNWDYMYEGFKPHTKQLASVR